MLLSKMTKNPNVFSLDYVIYDVLGDVVGKFVSRHFGNTPYFVIAEADSTQWTIVERRENTPACAEGGYEHGRFTESVKVIDDCGAVICSRIGGFAQDSLRAMGIQPLEKAVFI
jgi:nitrogen fixation protein NifX